VTEILKGADSLPFDLTTRPHETKSFLHKRRTPMFVTDFVALIERTQRLTEARGWIENSPTVLHTLGFVGCPRPRPYTIDVNRCGLALRPKILGQQGQKGSPN